MASVTQLMTWLREGEDPKVDGWFLMDDPVVIIGIVAVYLTFVIKLGPSVMQNRKPYALRNIIFYYNGFQVLYNIGMVVFPLIHPVALRAILSGGCDRCYEDKSSGYYVVRRYCWFYVMAKVIDLSDTVFFVLRKKSSQVTFLHVYHHAIMVVQSFALLKYAYGEQSLFAAFLNSLVHVVMYAYYLLSSLGPEWQKRLWWKRYITSFQLVQFVLIIISLAIPLVKNCPTNKFTSISLIALVSSFLYLFSQFYKQSYVRKEENSIKSE